MTLSFAKKHKFANKFEKSLIMKRIYIILTLVCALFLSGQNIYAQLSERGKLPPVKVENIDAEKVEGTWYLSHFNFYTENPEQDNNFSCIVYRITKDSISTCYHSYRGKDIDKVFFYSCLQG